MTPLPIFLSNHGGFEVDVTSILAGIKKLPDTRIKVRYKHGDLLTGFIYGHDRSEMQIQQIDLALVMATTVPEEQIEANKALLSQFESLRFDDLMALPIAIYLAYTLATIRFERTQFTNNVVMSLIYGNGRKNDDCVTKAPRRLIPFLTNKTT